ncbi:MAG TPA: hypothetical protein VN922_00180 [Bacteroidia bacterium]|nr:hypothetical protein [Bacteroidia bacterium]
MKSSKNISLFVLGMILLALAFASCKSVAPPPSAPHGEHVHGESRWN